MPLRMFHSWCILQQQPGLRTHNHPFDTAFNAAARTMVTEATSAPAPLLFRQLFDSGSSTFTYILADSASREAVMIDPVLEQVR